MIEVARPARMSTVIVTTLGGNGASLRVMDHAGLRPIRAGIGEATGPIPVVEHWEIVYPPELSEAAALPA